MLCIFLYGALFVSYPGYREAVERNFTLAFATGIGIIVLFVGIHYSGYRFVFGYNLPNLLKLGIESLSTLCWLIVLLGFSQRNLNFSNRFLEYASEAVLPFYILHQTVIIVFGYYIVNTDLSLMVKYIIINLLALVFTVAIYETSVKRFGVLRVLFGMPVKAKKRLQPVLSG